ncbi:MAG: transposase, partial [Coprobacillus sp.]
NETYLTLNNEAIKNEIQYDGFYGVCTTLEDPIDKIIEINKQRWEIEESFRIMKTDFKSRPVYLQRDERIKAHFLTCFITLMIYRILEKKLDEKYTCSEIISTLREMNLLYHDGFGYEPTYTRTDITDDLHEIFNIQTDTEIVSEKNMKKFIKQTKQ